MTIIGAVEIMTATKIAVPAITKFPAATVPAVDGELSSNSEIWDLHCITAATADSRVGNISDSGHSIGQNLGQGTENFIVVAAAAAAVVSFIGYSSGTVAETITGITTASNCRSVIVVVNSSIVGSASIFSFAAEQQLITVKKQKVQSVVIVVAEAIATTMTMFVVVATIREGVNWTH